MKAILAKLDEGLFGWGSPLAMGVYRILLGVAHLANWAIIGQHFEQFFTEKGLVTKDLAARFNGDVWRFNPLMSTPDNVTRLLYVVMILSAVCVMIGLFTRVSSVLLALLTIAFHVRNPVLLHGGDTLLRNMTILMALAPAGAALSVDAFLRRRRGEEPIGSVSLWPQRMMALQLAVVYVTSVVQKWNGESWKNGTATWYPPQLTEFQRFPVPAFLDTQPWLTITSYGTMLLEVALGTLVFWKPARRYVVLGGLLLHGSIEWRFNIPLFAFTICSCYVLYYSGEEWSQTLMRIRKRWNRGNEQAPSDVPL
ncbi:MAG: HTTM domain-containing protein [Chthonomonas sp.]|nr:HTTM domain-containing protein [Chthonomonas sp.]